jgi:hypothetical protein
MITIYIERIGWNSPYQPTASTRVVVCADGHFETTGARTLEMNEQFGRLPTMGGMEMTAC